MNYREHREQATKEIIEAIKNGTAPWMKPWDAGNIAVVPCNGVTGRRYRGMNKIGLFMKADNRNYDDNRWYTFNQVQGLGGKINKGEKGTIVEYWQFKKEENKKDENGKLVLDENGKPVKVTIRFQQPRVFHAVVFNAKQCSGIPPIKLPDHEWTPEQRAEKVLENSTAVIKHKPGDNAFYRPSKDEIVLPLRQQFKDETSYYETAFHELSHWTGHPTRLDREMSTSFGSPEYSKEELRAELGALFVCGDLGLNFNPKNHANYIEGWVKALEEDSNYIFKAASEAEGIADYISKFETQKLERDEAKHFKFDLKNKADLKVKILPQQKGIEGSLESFLGYRVNSNIVGSDGYKVLADLQNISDNSHDNVSLIINDQQINVDINNIKNLKNANQQSLISDFLVELGIDNQTIKKVREVEENYSPDVREDFKKNHKVHSISEKESKQKLHPVENKKADANTQDSNEKLTAVDRNYINVPYRDKNEAKALGAKWDNKEKSWYFENNLDAKTFDKWRENKQESSKIDKDEFIKEKAQAIEQRKEYSKKAEQNVPTENRQFLEIHYSNKDEAKALGAKWDTQEKSWYVQNGEDISRFSNLKNPKVQAAANIKGVLVDSSIPSKYLNVPYTEAKEAKELGAKWDSKRKQWYVTADKNVDDFKKWDNPISPKKKTSFKTALNNSETAIILDKPVLDVSKLISSHSEGINIKGLGEVAKTTNSTKVGKIIHFKNGDKMPISEVFAHVAKTEKPLDLVKVLYDEKLVKDDKNIGISLKLADVLDKLADNDTIKFSSDKDKLDFKNSVNEFKEKNTKRQANINNVVAQANIEKIKQQNETKQQKEREKREKVHENPKKRMRLG